jgi:UDP-N-acetylglucosamine/UDP-N-acetylgalactosamine diphosphorylase
VGVILLAAGDGRRLGFDLPKGMYELELPHPLSFFELFVERVKYLSELALKKYPNEKIEKEAITLYIVISDSHTKIISKFFEDKGYFGYKRICFCEVAPAINCFDENNQIMMQSPGEFVKASFGNGMLIE